MADPDDALAMMVANLRAQTGQTPEPWGPRAAKRMGTHRVRLAAAGDLDAPLIAWLRQAYQDA